MSDTIIIGSLNDKELKNTINQLVAHVEQGVKTMAESFNGAIEGMKNSLKSLGNVKVDMGSASDGGASRRTKLNNDEAKSIKETTIAYDSLATAIQKATQPKSAEQSFYTFIQNYREQAAKLANEIKTLPSQSLDRQFAEYQRFENEINNVRGKIQELRAQLNELGKDPKATRVDIKYITDQIYAYENRIKQLTLEQISSTRRIANEDNALLTQKQALYDKTVKLVRELTVEQGNSTNATRAQLDAQDRLTKKIQHQAEIIRQRMQESGSNHALWGNAVIYKEGYDARTRREHLSIEEQLLQAHQRQIQATQERIAAEQRERQAKQESVIAAQQQVQAEQQINQAQQQRASTNASTKKTFQTYEDFSKALAHVLGLQGQEIRLADAETSSYVRLQSTLKTLQAAYNQLNSSERNSDNGKTLVASMHEVERAISKIQQQSARPVNMANITGLSEKTLDDIAYKMQMLSRYRSGIDLTNPKSKDEIQKINMELERLKKTQDDLIGKNSKYIASNEMLGRSFEYIKNRLAFMFTIGASTQFAKQIYEILGQYELLERSIGILFDSMQQGSQIFAELNAMAIKSPFTTMELGAAAKQLSAYDIKAKDVVDTTKRLADMAAAVGVPIERLTYALGQIKAYGYLNARDARMFANAGIPLVQNLADMYTKLEGRMVSIGDVYDRIKKKAISFEDVLKVVNEMTDEGGRFFNFQEKAADTLKVKLANLTLAYNNMINEIGKSNQKLLSLPLTAIKTLLDNWRNLSNVLYSMVIAFGVVKAAQAIYIAYTQRVGLATALADVSSQKLINTLYATRAALVGVATNPFLWATVAITYLGYLIFQMRDLSNASENLNKSISDNAKENIQSIDKFFSEYKKDIETINSLSVTEQQKMWERIKEEIEKTTKNAREYIELIESIPDVSSKITTGSNLLSQIQQIQGEAQRLADHGFFSVGGGFANNGLADDLIKYEKSFNGLIKKYGSLAKAAQDAADKTSEAGMGISFHPWQNYNEILGETEAELNKFTSILDNANISKIMGDFAPSTQLANIREFADIVRDNFLATERGQKISAEGRALLNNQIDSWIAKQGVANNLLSDERAKIEESRTAWQSFFSQLNKTDKDTIDYLILSNQTGSDEFKKIWDKAAKSLQESSTTSYNVIQEQIAKLRNTPDIVIDIIYRNAQEALDDQQKEFKDYFLTPRGKGVMTAEEYLKQVKELTAKYGRFQKKEGEDNVEWEKRLGDEYRKNEENIKRLNAQLKNSANLSDVDRKAKEDEKKTLEDQNKALEEVRKRQNFNYDKEKSSSGGKKDILGEALQKEVEIITNIQKKYKDYQKMGVDAQTSITKATDEYARTLASTNATLNQFGIKTTKSGKELANMDLRDLRSYYQGLLAMAAGLGNAKGIEVLEKAISNINEEITKLDYKKITDGLNNELSKLKDEYELGIELDANPELGGIFADMMGISQDELQELPRNFEQFVSKAQEKIDKLLKDNGINSIFNLQENLNTSKFDKWVKQSGRSADSSLVTELKKYVTESNKIRLNESKNQIEEWNKLLEKYSEYESKVTQIQKEAEKQRETARKAGATKEIFDAINRWEKQELASLSFEEFQKSPEWIVATGDLATLSRDAIGLLIAELEKYKKSAKNLSPKQIKEMNRALSKLYKEQRKGNPFAAIANVIDEAKNNMSAFDEEIEKVNEDIAKTEVAIAQATLKGEDTSKLQSRLKNLRETWKKLREEQEAAGKIDATTMVRAINETISAVSAAVGVFNDLAKAISGVNENDIDKTFAILDKAGQGALIGAQFGGYGAAIGAAAGLATGLIQTLANAGNEKITKQVEDSELAVKRLQNSYNDLQHAVEQAYGAMEIGARKAMVANRELELEELQRQLQLERSRKNKNRDNDRIADLEGQIIDLKNELVDMRAEITNSFLGISSVSDAITSMMDAIVDALRNGEDAMAKVNDSVDDMIANMIKQVFSAKIVGPMIEDIWNKVDEDIQARGKKWADEYASWKAQYDSISTSTNDTGQGYFFLKKGNEYKATESGFERTWLTLGEKWEEITYEQWKKMIEDNMKNAEGELKKATTPTMDDVRNYAGMLRGVSPELEAYMDDLENILREMGLIKDTTSEKALSSLQQGIQGVTEDTAGAIEAITSGMSQQIYKQSDLLTQIRDAVIGMDVDVSVGVMSQILLQLQSSYQTQNAIRSIMEGWSSANGMSVRVEMI